MMSRAPATANPGLNLVQLVEPISAMPAVFSNTSVTSSHPFTCPCGSISPSVSLQRSPTPNGGLLRLRYHWLLDVAGN